MFTLYKSLKFNLFVKSAFKVILNEPLLNPLTKEIFIVNNKETEQWIKIFIAKKYKVCTNIKFFKLKHFILNILKQNTPKLYSKSEFSKYSIMWKIINIPDIQHLLTKIVSKNNTYSTLFKIASSISNLFQLYLKYRPDYIKKWEQKSNIPKTRLKQKWQQIIWMRIIKYTKDANKPILHFSNLLYDSIKKMQRNNFINTKLPVRIFIFNITPITPQYAIFLKSISKYCSVHFFYATASYNDKQMFSTSFIKFKQTQEISNNQLLSLLHSKNKNIIYHEIENFQKNTKFQSYWITYEYEQMLFLSLIKDKTINLNFKIKQNSLLQYLQNKILNLHSIQKKNNEQENNKILILKTDKSLSIHSCHTLIREIEVLHNNLLNILNDNNDILFQDVLVISKNLDTYIPYINQIFNSASSKNFIPFSINYKNIKNIEFYKTILELIDLPNIELNINKITNLLNIPTLLKKVQINEQEIPILLQIINQTEIQWENDNILSNDWLSNDITKCWEHGLQRIFLGQIINNIDYKFWENIVPYNEFSTLYYNIFNKLISLISLLNKWKKILSKPKFLSHWDITFKKLLNDFFTDHEQKQPEAKLIIKKWTEIIHSGMQEKYTKKISITLLKNELCNSVSYISQSNYLFSGKITFCNNFTLTNIPFKIIYLIGLNDNISSNTHESFDIYNLLKLHPRAYDPCDEINHKNLLLKTLLSAKKFFYISHQIVSNNYKKLNNIPIAIDKIIKYITQYFYIKNKNKDNFNDNLKDIKSHIYHNYTFYAHEKRNFLEKLNYPNFNTTIWKMATLINNSHKEFIKKLPSIKNQTINYNTLILFWKNPIQTFFHVRLNIQLNTTKNKHMHQNKHFINKLDQYKMNKTLLKFFLYKQNTNQLFQYYKNIGIIPNNNIGNIIWEYTKKLITPLYDQIMKIKKILNNSKFCINVKNKCMLHGQLKNINSSGGLLRWKATKLSFQDIISCWLEHLLYCSLYKKHNSILIGTNHQIITFYKLENKTAKYYLKKYISGYFDGMEQPILLTKSGINWINAIYDKKNNKFYTNTNKNLNAYKIFLNTWNGNNWITGEKDDPYIQKMIVYLTKKNIQKIYKTTKKWLTPILKNISYSKYH
ncbi:exodeoxyribonuclease V gamma chain [Buchnera aphidicola str. Bp (Baizongia pistaciae)]|uniref:RecBCD enzyme subunit RecC n=1 Tax=Buchnera aphidicola subsp. Baizongia pistaciae (strain Bp) TaxID=224915 RepID=RECC_BUCBP|nr:exodeoxyribonuclease V subunit gamma [Buchnera aphidicola]Q89AB4.1 RecName: Full=RecBCD enzyme subunit RecC; AltName: Full=Exonuclease V subunit RecC; Short=ExoV subunit RecC; AltName: Full=Helicase/nuclease RecBCD subunit RecC [Buchnera aphidicola str. Bp (Baizongia pistaciae)]AAO27115.1 exodeoxyribonuclease V gamma chain [Buchnera aphidicola str. Bp (Baizongia pistaciae)]